MKKLLKLILISIIVLALAITIYVIDSIRIIEKPLDNVLKIAKEQDGDNLRDRIYAYTIAEQEDKVIVTFHSASDWIKTIYTYYIENEIITKCHKEIHYASKFIARTREVILKDKKITGNIVTGWEILERSDYIAEEWFKNLEEQLNTFSVKLN